MFLAMKIKFIPYTFQKKSYEMLNLLLITEKDKFHYVFIKDFNRLMFSKTKQRYKTLSYVMFTKF